MVKEKWEENRPKTLASVQTSPTTPSILLPCLGQRTKCTPCCFKVIYWQLQLRTSCYSHCFLKVQTHSHKSCKLFRTDSCEIIYPVRTERTKTIPCPAAHPCIGHIREYPPPPPTGHARKKNTPKKPFYAGHSMAYNF